MTTRKNKIKSCLIQWQIENDNIFTDKVGSELLKKILNDTKVNETHEIYTKIDELCEEL